MTASTHKVKGCKPMDNSTRYSTMNLNDAYNQTLFRQQIRAEVLAEVSALIEQAKSELRAEIANEAITTQDSINKAIDKHERYDHQTE